MRKIIAFKSLILIYLVGFSLINMSHAKAFSMGTGSATDTIPPVISLIGKDTVYVEVLGNYIDEGATALDNIDGNLSSSIVLTGSVNTNALGVYGLTFSVKDIANNKTSKTRVVIVSDTQKPVISNSDANDSNEVKVLACSIFIDRTRVVDNFDTPNLIETKGPAGAVDTKAFGIYPIEYNATDQSGNKAETKIYKFIVSDFLGPTINLNTPDSISWSVNNPYIPVGPTVNDNCSSSSVTLTRTSNINSYLLGLYFEEYTATDASGNITKRRRFVRIIDNEAPVIRGEHLNVKRFSNPNLKEGITITDNYDFPVNLHSRLKIISNNVNTSVEGVYTITFQVTDLSGNISLPFERFVWVGDGFFIESPSLEENSEISIYPNPSTGTLNVVGKCDSPENVEIEIYNASGNLVSTFKGSLSKKNAQTFDLSEESSGLYNLRIKTNRNTISHKVYLQNSDK